MEVLKPKIVIVCMIQIEAENWYVDTSRVDLRARRIRVPGLFARHPEVLCTANGDVCQVITGEGLINASLTMSALLNSPLFNFSETYFLIAGIAGVNPSVGTTGTVSFARYAVQFDIQYEFDAREIPLTWSTGYVPMGGSSPKDYPTQFYGTELFILNDRLRDAAMAFARSESLKGSDQAAKFRKRYANAPGGEFDAATYEPSIIAGDVASANCFFHGGLLSKAVERYCALLTKGRARYAMAAQEDNGTLAALSRAAEAGKVDFSRVILLRSGSNFDRPPPDGFADEVPLHTAHGGLDIALENLYIAGYEVVKGILSHWEELRHGLATEATVGNLSASVGNLASAEMT